jgi:hypothetical protein
MKMHICKVLSILLFPIMVSACASIPLSSPSEDAEAKRFEATAGTSKIYIYRKKAFSGSAIKLPLSLDSVEKGPLASGTFFLWNVAPGKHEIFCSGTTDSSLTIDTQPGKLYFVQQILTEQQVSTPGCLLRQMDEQKAKADISKISRGQSK